MPADDTEDHWPAGLFPWTDADLGCDGWTRCRYCGKPSYGYISGRPQHEGRYQCRWCLIEREPALLLTLVVVGEDD